MKKSTLLILAIPLGIAFYFVYVGIGWNVLASFTDWNRLVPSYGFVGFSNYAELFQDSVFWISLQNSLLLFLMIPACIGLGLLLATLLDRNLRWGGVFRNIYLLPFSLAFVVTGMMWLWMYNREGIINTLIGAEVPWTGPDLVMISVLLALIWQFSGYTTLILLAGMKSVSGVQIQAAKMDGASDFNLYRKIVYPQLKPFIMMAVVVLVIFALKAFDLIWVLTGGGPGYSSYTLPIMMYRETFQANHFAYGAAIASILLAIVAILIVPYMYKTHKRR